jgi:hypothetical protein
MPDVRARVTPEGATEGFGKDPGSARLVDAGSVEAALAFPGLGLQGLPRVKLRVGRP